MSNLKKAFILCLAAFAIFFVRQFVTRPAKITEFSFTGTTMATTYSIKITGISLSGKENKKLKEDIDTLLSQLNLSFNGFQKDSEVSLFNEVQDTSKFFKISSVLYHVLDEAKRISERTKGYFDITVTPLVDLWGFGFSSHASFPTEKEIQEALSQTGMDKLILANGSIRKTIPQLRLNLSAIAKGYAVDLCAELLKTQGIKNFIVEIGGEVFCNGFNSQNKPWKVGIDTPDPSLFPGQKVHTVIEPGNNGTATSGNYRQIITKNGKTYSHIIHPKTGYPVSHNLTSVTVIAPTCLEADAIATALFVMGNEQGLAWTEATPGVEALFIKKNPDNTFTTSYSKGFPAFLS